MEIVAAIKAEAQFFFHGAQGSHAWEHTERVLTLAQHLAEKEGADIKIVQYAALLHDIARHEEDAAKGKIDHAKVGAIWAQDILRRHQFQQDDIDKIIHCIKTHRFRQNNQPQTLEAKVLFDADKLDAIGAVGIGRAFLFAGEVGAKLHNPNEVIEKTLPYSTEDTAYREYMVKLRHIKDCILTAEGKRLAEERHAFMIEFFNRLNQEVEGVL